MTAALQSELQAIEPALTALARNLGQSPEEVLREAIAAKEKEWAHRKLDEAIAGAYASGLKPIAENGLLAEVKARVAERSLQKAKS